MDLAEARARLAAYWKAPVKVGEVYVAHHERVVFGTVDPGGRRVVVKAHVDPDTLDREVATTRAAGAAIPAPEVLVHLPGLAVFSWLEGEPLVSASPDPHWAAVGRALRRLHDHAPIEGIPGFAGADDWWGWFQDWTPQQRDRDLIPHPALRRLVDLMEAGFADAAAPPRRLLHGDGSTIHWRIRGDGSAAALDFGDACVGDPLWDLVVLTHWDAERLPVVLDGYGADAATRERAARLFEPYRVARHLLAIDWLVGHGYDPTPTVDELIRISRCDSARTGE